MNKSSSPDGVASNRQPGLLILLLVLFVVLVALFHRSFIASQILYSNDGPLGIISAQCNVNDWGAAGGTWQDLNWLGSASGCPSPSFSMLLLVLLKPLFYAKFAAPIGLLFLGFSAWLFFRQLRLAPIACVAGGIAAALNSDFFSTACWGVAFQSLCVAANYLALAAIARVGQETAWRSWVRVILAGFAVGMGVMQGWDVGALFSLFVGAYVLYQAVFMNEAASGIAKKTGCGIGQVVLVAVCAGVIATNSVISVVGTQIVGVAGMAQDEATRQQEWRHKTEWSLPENEILQVVVPGLFGYRNAWHMYNDHQPGNDQYWGLIGEDASSGMLRLSGTGLYAGVFVLLISLWAICQSFRSRGSPFSVSERRAIWFWLGVTIVTTLLAFGKYLPAIYRLFYSLPYASTIRNPTKFMHIFSWALMIIFAYGMHGLFVSYMATSADRTGGIFTRFKSWWASASSFEQIWVAVSILSIGASGLAWVVYSGKMSRLAAYLQTVGIPDPQSHGVTALDVAHFSLAAVAWFILFLALSVGLLLLIFTGLFSGARAKWGAALVVALLLVDLGRADVPWIAYWDTGYEYAPDPVVSFLANRPYEQRVGMLPWGSGSSAYSTLFSMYGTPWKQHVFWSNNIECVDIVQEPRVGEDKMDFMAVIEKNYFRYWELTGTRYLLGESEVVNYLNADPNANPPKRKPLYSDEPEMVKYLDQQLPPGQPRFKLAQLPDGRPATFTLTLKPGAPAEPKSPADILTVIDSNGPLAVIEFTGALPRASLIPNWQVSTNEEESLRTLDNPAFNPRQTVLVTNPMPTASPAAHIADPGSVVISDYAPKRVALNADVKSASVLLMLDRYSPQWEVTVDGKPSQLLRCNFIERGVYLTPGKHQVVFDLMENHRTFLVSLVADIVGLALCGFLAFGPKPTGEPENSKPDASTTKPGSTTENRQQKPKKN